MIVAARLSRGAAREPDGAALRLDTDGRLRELPGERLSRRRQPHRGERADAVLELRRRRVHDRRRDPARPPLARVERTGAACARPVYVGGLASVLLLALGFALTQVDERGRRRRDASASSASCRFRSSSSAGLLRTRLARDRRDAAPAGDAARAPSVEEAEAALRRAAQRPDAPAARPRGRGRRLRRRERPQRRAARRSRRPRP